MSRDFSLIGQSDKIFENQKWILGGGVLVKNCKNIVFNSCEFFVSNQHGALFIENSEGILVDGCTFSNDANGTGQCDLIYSQQNTGNAYVNSTFRSYHNREGSHTDCIQCYLDRDGSIAGNRIYLDNDKARNNQGIYITNAHGKWEIISNLVRDLRLATTDALITFHRVSEGDGRAQIIYNELIGSQFGAIHINNHPGSVVSDNTICSQKENAIAIKYYGDGVQFKENSYFAPNSQKPFNVNGKTKSFEEWEAMGNDLDGVTMTSCPEAETPPIDPKPPERETITIDVHQKIVISGYDLKVETKEGSGNAQ